MSVFKNLTNQFCPAGFPRKSRLSSFIFFVNIFSKFFLSLCFHFRATLAIKNYFSIFTIIITHSRLTLVSMCDISLLYYMCVTPPLCWGVRVLRQELESLIFIRNDFAERYRALFCRNIFFTGSLFCREDIFTTHCSCGLGFLCCLYPNMTHNSLRTDIDTERTVMLSTPPYPPGNYFSVICCFLLDFALRNSTTAPIMEREFGITSCSRPISLLGTPRDNTLFISFQSVCIIWTHSPSSRKSIRVLTSVPFVRRRTMALYWHKACPGSDKVPKSTAASISMFYRLIVFFQPRDYGSENESFPRDDRLGFQLWHTFSFWNSLSFELGERYIWVLGIERHIWTILCLGTPSRSLRFLFFTFSASRVYVPDLGFFSMLGKSVDSHVHSYLVRYLVAVYYNPCL